MKKLKLLLMGIDGASHSVTSRLIEQGRLPHLASLKKEASWAALQRSDEWNVQTSSWLLDQISQHIAL